jgi:hypothetical protein
MTASSSTSQKRAIFDLIDWGRKPVRPADDDVRLDADRPQLLHRVLGGLGLELARGLDERHEREVDVDHVLAPDVLLQLRNRLEEREALDVADRAADLDDLDVDVLARPAGWTP